MENYRPLAGETMSERKTAELEDNFAFQSACAAQKYKTWDQFLSENPTFRGLLNDGAHRTRYEQLRSRALYNLHTGSKEQIDPNIELQLVRDKRHKEYERQNVERRYEEVKDAFMQAAFNGKSWQTVEKELLSDDQSPWDESLYRRACKEAGYEPTDKPDQSEENFKQGFYM